MKDRCLAQIDLLLTLEEFRRVPRHAAYRYDHLDGKAWITPRPRYFHVRLDLASFRPLDAAKTRIRPLQESDWAALPAAFANAFAGEEPFACGTDEERVSAACLALDRTRTGGDGPVIAPACLIANDAQGTTIGALLTTLVPAGDPENWGAFIWDSPPPEDSIEQRAGVPHLTWIFIAPSSAGQGVGTALLARAVEVLRGMGFDTLFSTFLAGNVSSMLWHWRQGFALLAYPGSYRRYRRESKS